MNPFRPEAKARNQRTFAIGVQLSQFVVRSASATSPYYYSMVGPPLLEESCSKVGGNRRGGRLGPFVGPFPPAKYDMNDGNLRHRPSVPL